MTSTPWMKFYPRDWRGDQALRAVSIGARGLWMECLCIMHEAEPYGHLLLNGEIPGDDALARMTGTSVDELRSYMAELRQAGVLSVTRKGIITSRRMIKDFSKAQKGKTAVNLRWSQPTEKKGKTGGPNRVPTPAPITHIPEAREQKEASLRSAGAARGKPEVDRVEALCRAAAGLTNDAAAGLLDISPILTLLDRGYDLDRDIVPVLKTAAARGKRGRSWSYYLLQIEEVRSRNNQIGPPSAGAGNGRILAEPTYDEIWQNRLKALSRGQWIAAWGPKPGEPGCEVPRKLLPSAHSAEVS